MNKSTGNMYSWTTHTWNPIAGRCPHECVYCYMKKFKLSELKLKESLLLPSLGTGRIIFIGSATDMWANAVPSSWIKKVLAKVKKFPENRYLFQTKNPERFHEFLDEIPKDAILGTTIETDEPEFSRSISRAPHTAARVYHMQMLRKRLKMISMEPLLESNAKQMRSWAMVIEPEFISIGADSKGHGLPEPDPETVDELIQGLRPMFDLKLKRNLARLLEPDPDIFKKYKIGKRKIECL